MSSKHPKSGPIALPGKRLVISLSRVLVSRSIFALVNDRDGAFFGRGGGEKDEIGFLDENARATFGRTMPPSPICLSRN